MEKLQIIKGKVSYLTENVQVLLDGAMKYFGDKYQDVLLETIQNVYFYEQDENETKQEVLEELTGNILLPEQCEFLWAHNDHVSFYFLNPISNKRTDQIIIYRKVPNLKLQKSLSRELFGHAVCGHLERYVNKNGKQYQRNGIALSCGNAQHHMIASEGFMEFISSRVLEYSHILMPNLMISSSYRIAYMNAEFICDNVGKEKVLDHLVLNKGNIIAEFNKPVDQDYFGKLEEMSEKGYLKYQKYLGILCSQNRELQGKYQLLKRMKNKKN